jgi:quercetin dioxygenase-like cupin family protein
MSHEGEEFHFVLEGKLEFRTDDRVEVLEAGDSLFFESGMNHGFRALTEVPAKVLVVLWGGA